MNSRIGIRVFPNETSPQILRSTDLLHYSPAPEPPIDYTIREKPKRRPDYAVTSDVFRRELSPVRQNLMARGRPRASRRSTQVVGEVLSGRRDTVTESEKILEELNAMLEEAMTSKGPVIAPERRRSLERVKSLAVKGQQAQIAPVLRAEVIEDLHRLSLGEGISKINQNRKQDVEEMYEKTRKLIETARNTYTKDYFISQYAARPLPQWQKDLLAGRAAKEMLRKYEEKAWVSKRNSKIHSVKDEFDEWKRRCAPQVQLLPDYRFWQRPALS